MATDTLDRLRQYTFAAGPNYTDELLTLADTECADADNVYWRGGIRHLPGASRLISTPRAGAVVGLTQYNQADGTSYFLAVDAAGRLAYQNGATWTTVSTGLPTTANTFYNWVTFNNTLVVLDGSTPKTWNGVSFGNLGGSPPSARFGSVHGDYVLLSGQTANPSQVQYSDTATLQSYPAGNILNIGLDDGQILTGQVKYGDATVFFKERSIYLMVGSTASDFTVNPTISDVGNIAPNSLALTDQGIFFWSEVGPALFNGYKTVPLYARLDRKMDVVNWDAPLVISAAYYPYRKYVLVSYAGLGSTSPDRGLLIDLGNLSQQEGRVVVPAWPFTFGFTAAASAVDSTGRKRVYLGTSDGYVLTFDDGTTWNAATVTGRLRTKAYTSKRGLEFVGGQRLLEAWFGGTTTRVGLKTSVDGGTFVTHGQSPFTLSGDSVTNRLDRLRADGDGGTKGALILGRTFQHEWTLVGSTPFSFLGQSLGLEALGARETTSP